MDAGLTLRRAPRTLARHTRGKVHRAEPPPRTPDRGNARAAGPRRHPARALAALAGVALRCLACVALAPGAGSCDSGSSRTPPEPNGGSAGAAGAGREAEAGAPRVGVGAGAARGDRHLRLTEAPDGDVAAIVRSGAADAEREGRRLLVYVGAAWCEPCRAFHAAAERGSLDGLFGDLTLVAFDLDRDGDRLKAAGYASRYIPLFAVPAPDGTSSGRQIEGSIKGDGAVANIVPRLRGLLAR